MSNLIQRVAIVGGTHGNERTGVYLVKKFEQFPELIQRPSFETTTLFGNPKAIAENRRYIDRDLNRCFASEDLSNSALTSYEDHRAKEIAARLTSEHTKVDAIIDLHTTTANMGISLHSSSTAPANLRLLAYLSQLDPAVRVFWTDIPVLPSLSPMGYTIEVGAIAQGVLNAHYLEQTERIVHAILDYLDAMNRGELLPAPPNLVVYQAVASIDYPKNEAGEQQAVIHPQLQSKDYQPLQPGEPMFLTMAGELIDYPGDTTVFPIFINEAAYYEKGVALILTEKHQFELDDCLMLTAAEF